MIDSKPRSEREKPATRAPTSGNLDWVDILAPEIYEDFHEKLLPGAQEAVRAKVRCYAEDLIRSSVCVQSQAGTEKVSKIDVDQGQRNLHKAQPPSVYRKLSGILGGIVLGSAASNVFNMVLANHFSRMSVILTFAGATLGMFLIALEFSARTGSGLKKGRDPKRPVSTQRHTARVTRRVGAKV